MKIKALDIYGYGKWVNQRFDLEEDLQLFYGHNEAGKSTLQSFIRSILFGFPRRQRRNNQYKPKQGERYGGRLLVETEEYGELWIERMPRHLKLETKDGQHLPNRVLDQLLGGLDEELFDTFYAFSLDNLQKLERIDEEELNDFFLSIGTVGSDRFLQAAKELEASSDALYRPQATTRPLNLALQDLESQAQALQKTQASMAEYEELVAQRHQAQDAIQELTADLKVLEETNRQQELLLERYDLYLKEQGLAHELSGLTETPMPDQAKARYEDAKRQQAASQTKMTELETKIHHLQEELTDLTRLHWAQNHQEDRQAWMRETEHIKEVQTQLEQLAQRIQEQEDHRRQLAKQGQFYPDQVSPSIEYQEKVEGGLVIQSSLQDLQDTYDQILAERNVINDQRTTYQTYSAEVRQQIAQLEAQRMNEEAQMVELTSLKNYLYGLVPAVIGATWALVLFLGDQSASTSAKWLSLLLLLGGLGALGFTFYNHRQRYQDFQASPILGKIQELRSKEAQYTEQSQAYSQDWNARQEDLMTLDQEIESLRQDQARWLAEIGFYPEADPEHILTYQPVKSYFQALEKEEALEKEKVDLEGEISAWQASLAPLLDRFPAFENPTVRQLIRHVEEVEATLNTSIRRGEALQQRIDDAKVDYKKHQAAFKEQGQVKSHILQEAQSQDELDFQQKLATNERIRHLRQTIGLYQEQLKDHRKELEAVTSKQALTQELRDSHQKIEEMSAKIQPYHHQVANYAVEISRLEEDGTYPELQQRLADQEAAVGELVLEWGRQRVAMELIYRTLRQGIENPLPEMIDRATQLFHRLSYGRYHEIRLNKTGLKVRQFSDVLFEPHELSQGTLEQLYVALRLAFIQSAQEMVELPIMVDDAFVNFDEMRKASMYQVLEDLSQDHQILFFTFDSQAKATFEREHIIDLDQVGLETAHLQEEDTE